MGKLNVSWLHGGAGPKPGEEELRRLEREAAKFVERSDRWLYLGACRVLPLLVGFLTLILILNFRILNTVSEPQEIDLAARVVAMREIDDLYSLVILETEPTNGHKARREKFRVKKEEAKAAYYKSCNLRYSFKTDTPWLARYGFGEPENIYIFQNPEAPICK